jgi:hypothetical protein
MQDRPTALELLRAVREFLEADVLPSLEGRRRFHGLVAANVLGIVERELAHPPVTHPGDDWLSLALDVRDRLVVANPKHLDHPGGTTGS